MNLRSALSLATACVAGYALYASWSWPFRTALFPRVIALPILFLGLIELALNVWSSEKEQEGHAMDFQLTDNVEPALARMRTIAIIIWTARLSGAHCFGWLSSRSSNLCLCLFKNSRPRILDAHYCFNCNFLAFHGRPLHQTSPSPIPGRLDIWALEIALAP